MLPQVWILKNPDSRLVMSAAPMIFLSPQKILAKRTKKTKKNAIIRSISPEFRIHASQHIHKNMSGKSRLPKKVTPKYPDPSKHSYFENQQRLLKPSFITRFYWRVICDHQWSFKRNWRKKNGSLWCSSKPLNKSPRNLRVGPSFSAAIGIDASKTHLRCDQQAYLNKKQRQVQKVETKIRIWQKYKVFLWCDVCDVHIITKRNRFKNHKHDFKNLDWVNVCPTQNMESWRINWIMATWNIHK